MHALSGMPALRPKNKKHVFMICNNSHLSVGQDRKGQDGKRWDETEQYMTGAVRNRKVRYEAGHGKTRGEETGRD